MRIDAYDGTEAVALRDGGQANCGLSLVAPNLEDRPPGGSARRHERQESRFALRQEPWSGPYTCPGLHDRFSKIRRLTADGCWRSQQYCSNAAGRSAAVSRAFRA